MTNSKWLNVSKSKFWCDDGHNRNNVKRDNYEKDYLGKVAILGSSLLGGENTVPSWDLRPMELDKDVK